MAAVVGSSVPPLTAAGMPLSSRRLPPGRRSAPAISSRRRALPTDAASQESLFSSDLLLTPAAEDEQILTPSSLSTVRFADVPNYMVSQETPKFPPKRYSEPLRSAFASLSTRNQSQSRPPHLLHNALSRARELRHKATALLKVYERIADGVFRGVFLDDPQTVRSIQRAHTLWKELESYKTYSLFDQAPFNHHFIDVTEDTTGLSSSSADALLFDEITQSIYIANCAIFIHYAWNLPSDPSRILANGTTWTYRSLAELKEAWRVFWRLIVPASPASVDVTTQHLLDCYLELSTQAFLAQHFALLDRVASGALSPQQADTESIAHLYEVMSPDAVTDALDHGKIGFETQTQALTQGLPQSQISRHDMQRTWTLMIQQRMSAIETSGPHVDRLRATFTPLAQSVLLTDLAILILKGERREPSQSQDSSEPDAPAASQTLDVQASGKEERGDSRSSRTPSVTPSPAYTSSVEAGNSASTTLHNSQSFPASQRMAAFDELISRQRSSSRLSSQETATTANQDASSLSVRSDDTSMMSMTPSDSIENGTYPHMDAYGPFESTPLPRAIRPVPTASEEGSLSIDSLSSDEYMSQRAEWLAELIAQEESMSDSEHTETRSRSSSESYTESAFEDDSSRDTVMADLTTQDRSDALESLIAREREMASGRLAHSTSISRPQTPASSDSGTPMFDSPTRQALALPSTPDRPFVEKARRQSSSMAGRPHEPPPVRHANLIASSDSEQDTAPPLAPHKVIKFRRGRLVREIDSGGGLDFLRSRGGGGERVRKFSSQESSDSDIFLQRRAVLKQALESSPQQARAVQAASEERAAAEVTVKQEQATQAQPAIATPERVGPLEDGPAPADPLKQQHRFRASRQPQNPLLYVEVKTSRPTRRRWLPEEPRAPSRVAEIQESFSRMGVTSSAARESGRDDALENNPDMAHGDVPERFVIDMGRGSDNTAAADNRAQSELDQTARRRIEELMRLKDDGAYEGDEDAELMADRKQLTLEYWFARERPGFEHLPDPKGTGPVPVSLQRSAHRDLVLGTVDEDDEAGDGIETPPLPEEQGEHRRRHTMAGTNQAGETQAVDAAAGPSDPEDEDFDPKRRSRKRKSRVPSASGSRLRGRADDGDNPEEGVGVNVDTSVRSPRATGRKRVKVEQTQSSRKGKGRTLESLRRGEKRAQERATANPWTAEETECFLSAMYQLARLKEENPQYKIYSEILSRHGKYGSESRILAGRDNVSLKDKARSELWRMRRAGEKIPYWKKLYWSKVFDGRAPTWNSKKMDKVIRRQSGAASLYDRDVTIESQPHDGAGSTTGRPSRGSVVRGSHDAMSEVENASEGAEIAQNQSREAGRERLVSAESDDSTLTSVPETSAVKPEPVDALTTAEHRSGPMTRRRAKMT